MSALLHNVYSFCLLDVSLPSRIHAHTEMFLAFPALHHVHSSTCHALPCECFQPQINKRSCEAFKQMEILEIQGQPEHIFRTFPKRNQHSQIRFTQVPHSRLTLQRRTIHLTRLTCASPQLHNTANIKHWDATGENLRRVKFAPHTPGWYLQSADSQLLVCFYMQLRPKSSWAAWARPSVCTGDQFSSLRLLPESPQQSRSLRVLRSAAGITWWETRTRTEVLHNKAWWDMKGHKVLVIIGITPS